MKKSTLILGLALLGLIFSSPKEEIYDIEIKYIFKFFDYDPTKTYYYRIPLTYKGPMFIQIETNYYLNIYNPKDFKVNICPFYSFPIDSQVIQVHPGCLLDVTPVINSDKDLLNESSYSTFYKYSFSMPTDAEYFVISFSTINPQKLKTLAVYPRS